MRKCDEITDPLSCLNRSLSKEPIFVLRALDRHCWRCTYQRPDACTGICVARIVRISVLNVVNDVPTQRLRRYTDYGVPPVLTALMRWTDATIHLGMGESVMSDDPAELCRHLPIIRLARGHRAPDGVRSRLCRAGTPGESSR